MIRQKIYQPLQGVPPDPHTKHPAQHAPSIPEA
jgi:hypothetical protein